MQFWLLLFAPESELFITAVVQYNLGRGTFALLSIKELSSPARDIITSTGALLLIPSSKS